jgi:hypothetical protein
VPWAPRAGHEHPSSQISNLPPHGFRSAYFQAIPTPYFYFLLALRLLSHNSVNCLRTFGILRFPSHPVRAGVI